MRLSGRIWYEPGFGEGKGDFDKWKALVRAVSRGTFTPIIGPGLGEPVYGSLREATRQLAETSGFPLAEAIAAVRRRLAETDARPHVAVGRGARLVSELG